MRKYLFYLRIKKIFSNNNVVMIALELYEAQQVSC